MKDFDIEKLKGSENYHTWVFAIKNVIDYKGYTNCIVDPVTETDAKKVIACKALLSLTVEKAIYPHIQSCTSALEIWKALKRLYEDTGLSRKISLLRNLITTRLENFDNNMQSYIDQIMLYANKLNGIGFKMDDEWTSAILLAGLTDEYKPFIMSIEASNTKLEVNNLITKLVDTRSNQSSGNGEAFFSKNKMHKKKKFNKNFKRKCFSCGSEEHLQNECDKATKNSSRPKAKAVFIGIDKNNSNDEKIMNAMVSIGNEHEWYLDSGASAHMSPYKNILNGYSDSDNIKSITTANNEKINVCGSGCAMVNINDNDVKINNVLYVPKLCANLLSVKKIVENNNKITFDKNKCVIYNDNNEVITEVIAENGVYKIRENDVCMLSKQSETAMTWHRRLGHLNYQTMIKMRNGAVSGIEFQDDLDDVKKCEICAYAKQSRLPFENSTSETSHVLELIHSDICGPMETQSIGKARYILTFIDDYTRKVFCYYLHSKSQVYETFIEFKNLIENQTNQKIRKFRSDNGTEYINGAMQQLFKRYGIQHQTSNVYTPQQNGVSERMNRTIIEKAKCLLFDANLSKSYWAEAVNMATYLINKTISAAHGKVPDEMFFNKKVDLTDLKIFGSPVMVHVPQEKRKKLDKKSMKLIFMGYDENTKGYRCINPVTRKLTISRDVVFHENKLNNHSNSINTDEVRDVDDEQNVNHEKNEQNQQNNTAENQNKDDSIIDLTNSSIEDNDDPNDPDYHPGDDIVATVHQAETNTSENAARTRARKLIDEGVKIHRGKKSDLRKEIGEIKFNDLIAKDSAKKNRIKINYDANNETIFEQIKARDQQKQANKELHDESDESDSSNDSCTVMHAKLSVFNDINFAFKCDEKLHSEDPVTVKELKERADYEHWNNAMRKEMNSLNENKTWTMAELPTNKKVIQTKWIFKTKRNSDGQIVRYKARLVAKGYSQKFGTDYEETYAPVVRFTSIRFLISIAAQENFKIYQMDAVTAFLQGELKENIYINQPEGFNDGSAQVCKLNKAIYGLKQAGKVWNTKLDQTLKNFGLKVCNMDPCIYYTKELMIAIYVDDFLIFYKDDNILNKLKHSLKMEFKMKDIGLAKGCVGIRINQTDDYIELDQEMYTTEILKRFNMIDCNGIGNPADTSVKLSLNEEINEQFMAKTPYQEAVGSLLFLAHGTRPDISQIVHRLYIHFRKWSNIVEKFNSKNSGFI